MYVTLNYGLLAFLELLLTMPVTLQEREGNSIAFLCQYGEYARERKAQELHDSFGKIDSTCGGDVMGYETIGGDHSFGRTRVGDHFCDQGFKPFR
jgi:hypothetical protein